MIRFMITYVCSTFGSLKKESWCPRMVKNGFRKPEFEVFLLLLATKVPTPQKMSDVQSFCQCHMCSFAHEHDPKLYIFSVLFMQKPKISLRGTFYQHFFVKDFSHLGQSDNSKLNLVGAARKYEQYQPFGGEVKCCLTNPDLFNISNLNCMQKFIWKTWANIICSFVILYSKVVLKLESEVHRCSYKSI